MNKKNKLIIVLGLSFCIALMSLLIFGHISGGMIPYQNPSPELLVEYNSYVKTYTPIWYISIIVSLISVIIFFISLVMLLIQFFKK